VGIRLHEGEAIVAPADGWFLSDSELKALLMEQYDHLTAPTEGG